MSSYSSYAASSNFLAHSHYSFASSELAFWELGQVITSGMRYLWPFGVERTSTTLSMAMTSN
ncbi:hypothetical protein TorRG33x02_261300 [Trema orientale]|uniref:Uncharacterized protein n=1 Tax=Trema orientale TaxID=63057 RepID=A0A2P5D5R8_TREOI|nr:hypothetical protein TorRG33x02_261300 [Trema orientale]